MVGTGNLGVEVDVAALADDVEAVQVTYEVTNYHGLYIRLVPNGPLITLFRTGKYNIAGASSKDELFEAREQFIDLMREAGVVDNGGEGPFNISNIVVTADLGRKLDLNRLSVALGLENVEYEPEQFPGAVYRPGEGLSVVMLYSNGKIVITGSRTMEVAERTYDYVRDQVEKASSKTASTE